MWVSGLRLAGPARPARADAEAVAELAAVEVLVVTVVAGREGAASYAFGLSDEADAGNLDMLLSRRWLRAHRRACRITSRNQVP
ncbi:hypothetical protein [Streptomyces sp. NPDC057696]|uniref:hypothetical protein n=1 Tax=Streptomyces sp. NPDC057696 TaxID=3346218 RepID=UPI0036979C38